MTDGAEATSEASSLPASGSAINGRSIEEASPPPEEEPKSPGQGAAPGSLGPTSLFPVPPASHLGVTIETLEDHIRSANLEFLERVNDGLSLPVSVLVQQRDGALAELATAKRKAAEEIERAAQEHEKFVNYLMEEQLAQLLRMREQLKSAQEELQRARLLARPSAILQREVKEHGATDPEAAKTPDVAGESQGLSDALAQVERLRTELEGAFTEVDEARTAAATLQEERDDAIREADDIRMELQAEIDAARDEAFEIQTQLDKAVRELNDAHDEARDEALRLNEELDEVKRQLDDRSAEVLRLRARLGEGPDDVQHSRPPPSPASSELEAARREVKWLRQQLIDAKRQVSKVSASSSDATKRLRVSGSRAASGEPRKEGDVRREGARQFGSTTAGGNPEPTTAPGDLAVSLKAPKVPDISG